MLNDAKANLNMTGVALLHHTYRIRTIYFPIRFPTHIGSLIYRSSARHQITAWSDGGTKANFARLLWYLNFNDHFCKLNFRTWFESHELLPRVRMKLKVLLVYFRKRFPCADTSVRSSVSKRSVYQNCNAGKTTRKNRRPFHHTLNNLNSGRLWRKTVSGCWNYTWL